MPGFTSLIPLGEVAGEVLSVGPAAGKARRLVAALLARFGSELTVLRETPAEDLARVNRNLAEAIVRMVDSQPHHHPAFQGIDWSLVIDHHPILPEHPVTAPFVDIRPDYGATSSILTGYLLNLGIRPGKLLATALVYGIKADTLSFERHFIEADVKAFSALTRFADMAARNARKASASGQRRAYSCRGVWYSSSG